MLPTTYGDSHCDTDEKHVHSEIDVYKTLLMPKVIVETNGNCATQPKGQRHTSQPYAQRNLPIADEESEIDFQTNNEQEKSKANVCDKGQVGHGGGGKDGIGEARDATHDGRTKQDTPNYFGDDSRLADLGQRPIQQPAKYDDDAALGNQSARVYMIHCSHMYLDNEDDKGILGVIMRRIHALKHSALSRNLVGRGRRTGRRSLGDNLRHSPHRLDRGRHCGGGQAGPFTKPQAEVVKQTIACSGDS
jgi:hypothetical protein